MESITLTVSDIQHFSTGDGPGIRTTVFLKGCNLRCPWCHNPETISSHTETLHFLAANKSVTYGRVMSVEEILADVMEDAPFYAQSGGGVTISGGEPLLQAKGVAALAKALQAQGVSVLIDTAGCVPRSAFDTVLPFVDTVFFDWKSPDAAVYRDTVGGDITRVKDNLAYLLTTSVTVHVRIPLIPGINTSPEVCEASCRELKAMGVTRVDLLPFHRLGSGKYTAMGKTYDFASTPPLSQEIVESIRAIFVPHFRVTVEK